MKVKVEKSELSMATSRSQGAITDKTLGLIGLRGHGDKLIMSAADRILAIFNSIPSDVEQEGFVFIPARLFSDVVKELPDGPVLLEKTDAFLTIVAGRSQEFHMRIPIADHTDWRNPPEFDSSNAADLPAQQLCYIIDQVQFCVAYESPRNYGAVGFLHKAESSVLRLVGTDGYRLSYAEIAMTLPQGFLEAGVCLSKRALNELHRMGSEGFESVRLSISSDQTTLVAEVGDYKIYVRLSAVKYPKYQGVLPQNQLTPIEINRTHFQSVTKRVLLASDKTRALQLCFNDANLTLKSRTLGSSEGMESIPLKTYHKGERQLAVNGKYLTDVFSTIASQEVTLNFDSEDDPIVLIPRKELESCHSMHVLVPIRET